MSVFDVLTLFGGLAMFLFGMRLMGNALKEGSSGALKRIMERATNNVFTAFLLGMLVTALIQSSTATIVITSGLVAAGILTTRQSLGILIGANVGTTVTGQIIRLLDLNESAGWLQIFKPSTLAPVALVIGIVLIMFCTFKKHDQIGNIFMGFGILFSGLLTMTSAVNTLSDAGAFDSVFANLDNSPFLGYLSGLGVSFVLQSSSATIGILQTFSMAGQLTFKGIYAVICGIYLGDCVTTAIVCSIGAKEEARRVGLINVLFNLGKTVVALLAVIILHALGLIDGLWDATANPGLIANTNTVFNLVCALIFMPFMTSLEKISRVIIKDKPTPRNKYADTLESLDTKFFITPAIAFSQAYHALLTMFDAAKSNITKALSLFREYNDDVRKEINDEEENIDMMTDRIADYLVQFSAHISQQDHAEILNQYYKTVSEFERLGDHAVNIAEEAEALHNDGASFSPTAMHEIDVLEELLNEVLATTRLAFEKRDEDAARRVEPLEEVVDDMVDTLRQNHLSRLSRGECSAVLDASFINLMSDLERISDVCSNVGLKVLSRIHPDMGDQTHSYVSKLHQGSNEFFNTHYEAAHAVYYGKLKPVEAKASENEEK